MRLRVLLAILALLVADVIASSAGLFDKPKQPDRSLTPGDKRAAQRLLDDATAPAGFRRDARCQLAPGRCFRARTPLASMSQAAALALVQRFGLRLSRVTPLDCGPGLTPSILMCAGVASLSRFEVTFFVSSFSSRRKPTPRTVGTSVAFAAVARGMPSDKDLASAAAALRHMNAEAAPLAREALRRAKTP
jgi:hypothetical protein